MSETLGELLVRLDLDANPFQQGITNINRQMQSSRSEFAAFGKSAQDSTTNLDFLKTKVEALTSTIGLQEKKIGEYNSKLDSNRSNLERLSKEQENLTKNVKSAKDAYEESVKVRGKDDEVTKELKENYEGLNKELTNNQELVEKNGRQYENTGKSLNYAQGQLVDLQNELSETSSHLTKLESGLYQAGEKAVEYGKKISSVGDKMTDLGKDLSLKVTAPIVAFGTLSAKSFMDFESAFTGVTKTIDMTTAETDEMRESIVALSEELPHTKIAISQVAESAGQLGIQKENVLAFTEVILNMGVATNLTTEQAATDMARFANITKMPQENFERLGSTVVELGNNMATTESEILSMATRLAGAGSQIGLTEAQIVSMAAALSSVGIEVEAGGTAFSKTMIGMKLAVETGSDSLQDFANVAGMTVEDFVQLFEKDAAGAIAAFISGLGDTERHGKSTILLLEELGITEARQGDALRRLAGNHELFNASLTLGNKAWEENTALSKEAEMFNKTNANQLVVLKNRINSVAVEIGAGLTPKLIELGNKGVSAVTEKWKSMDQSQKDNLVTMGATVAAIGPLIFAGGKVAQGVGGLVTTIGEASKSFAEHGKILGFIPPQYVAIGVGVIAAGALVVSVIKNIMESNDQLSVSDRLLIDEQERMGEAYNTVAQKMAASNIQIMDSFTEASDSVSYSLEEIRSLSANAGEGVAEEFNASLVLGINSMSTQVQDAISGQTQEYHSMMRELYNLDGIISEEEQTNLSTIISAGNVRGDEVQRIEDSIYTIIEEAMKKRGHLTDTEIAMITAKQEQINAIMNTQVSKSQAELTTIYHNFNKGYEELSQASMNNVVTVISTGHEEQLTIASESYQKRLILAEEQRDIEMAMVDKNDKEKIVAIENQFKTTNELASMAYDQERIQAFEHRTASLEELQGFFSQENEGAVEAQEKLAALRKEYGDADILRQQEIKTEIMDITREQNQLYTEEEQRLALEITKILETARDEERTNAQLSGELGLEQGQKHSKGIKDGLEGGKAAIGAEATAIMDKIAEVLNSRIGEMASIGGQIALGIASGMSGSMGVVMGTSGQMMSGVLNQMRKKGEIQSPSRASERIFREVGRGAVVGLEKETRALETASRLFTQKGLDSLVGEVNLPINQQAQGESNGMGSFNEIPVIVHVYANDMGSPSGRTSMAEDAGRKIQMELRKRGI